jgi:glycosyltransferase involved in cell wall biosynthesis
VPPGVDDSAYRIPGGAADREPVILWIGRVEPYKRADVMIDAMPSIIARVPDARLVVVGEGSARKALAERAAALGVGAAVRFTGFISEEEKIAALERAAVVVNTSEKEGWGMTVIEGNACGAPSVSSDVPGLRDSVRDGETGLLVPYGDVGALAVNVTRVLADRELRRRFVANGLEWAARFSWDNVAADTQRLIEEAIAPSGAEPRLVASPFPTA